MLCPTRATKLTTILNLRYLRHMRVNGLHGGRRKYRDSFGRSNDRYVISRLQIDLVVFLSPMTTALRNNGCVRKLYLRGTKVSVIEFESEPGRNQAVREVSRIQKRSAIDRRIVATAAFRRRLLREPQAPAVAKQRERSSRTSL